MLQLLRRCSDLSRNRSVRTAFLPFAQMRDIESGQHEANISTRSRCPLNDLAIVLLVEEAGERRADRPPKCPIRAGGKFFMHTGQEVFEGLGPGRKHSL